MRVFRNEIKVKYPFRNTLTGGASWFPSWPQPQDFYLIIFYAILCHEPKPCPQSAERGYSCRWHCFQMHFCSDCSWVSVNGCEAKRACSRIPAVSRAAQLKGGQRQTLLLSTDTTELRLRLFCLSLRSMTWAKAEATALLRANSRTWLSKQCY